MAHRRKRKRRRRIRRFPRIFMPDSLRRTVRILRKYYNRLARRRRFGLRYFHRFDVFKTKLGDRNKIYMIELAEILKDQNVKPDLYLKVMCRYGRFKDAHFMPPCSWLAKKSTVEIFHWLYRKERKTYDLRTEFDREISGWSDLDIYSSIRDSQKMYRDATGKLGMHSDEAMVLLKKDLSPWFKAIQSLETPEGRELVRSIRLLLKHRKLRNLARRAYRRED